MKYFNQFVFILLILSAGFFLFLNYLALYLFKTAHSFYKYNPILTKAIHPGERISWKSDVEQYTSGVKVDVTSQLVEVRTDGVSGRIINFTSVAYTTVKGRHQFINSSFVVPDGVVPGKFKVVNTSLFHINSIRTIAVMTETEDFEIATPSAK